MAEVNNLEAIPKDIIDRATFEQILEMDDDEDERDFSKQIVIDFFNQAATTLGEMDKDLKEEDGPALSGHGHFLKGSSATLGMTKVKDSCEKIQHWGQYKDDTGDRDLPKDECLDKIKKILPVVKKEVQECKIFLFKFFGLTEDDDEK